MNEIHRMFYEDIRQKSMATGKRAKGSAKLMFVANMRVEESELMEVQEIVKETEPANWNQFTKLPKAKQRMFLEKKAIVEKLSPMAIAKELNCKLTNVIPALNYFKITYSATTNQEPEPPKVVVPELEPIMTYQAFKKLDDAARVETFDRYKKQYSGVHIAQVMDIPSNRLDGLIHASRKRMAALEQTQTIETPEAAEPLQEEPTQPEDVKRTESTITGAAIIDYLSGIEAEKKALHDRIEALETEVDRLTKIEMRFNQMVALMKGE